MQHEQNWFRRGSISAIENPGAGSRSPISDEEAEFYQQNGVEAAVTASKTVDDAPNSRHGSGNNRSGDLGHHEYDVPWALHGPIWLPRYLPRRFTNLSHLHLIKPYSGEPQDESFMDRSVHIPHRYEQILNKEWVFLLQAVAGTLKELILEHRMSMDIGDTLGDCDASPELKRVRSPYEPELEFDPDRGDKIFCTSVLRLLVEESDSFLQLRQLSFRGIQVKGMSTGLLDTGKLPGKNGEPDNDEVLRRVFPNCNIEIFESVYPIYAMCSINGFEYLEVRQDGGDGLFSNSFHTEYLMRFGPQWRIKD